MSAVQQLGTSPAVPAVQQQRYSSTTVGDAAVAVQHQQCRQRVSWVTAPTVSAVQQLGYSTNSIGSAAAGLHHQQYRQCSSWVTAPTVSAVQQLGYITNVSWVTHLHIDGFHAAAWPLLLLLV